MAQRCMSGAQNRTYYDPSAADVAAEEDMGAEPGLEQFFSRNMRRGCNYVQASWWKATLQLPGC